MAIGRTTRDRSLARAGRGGDQLLKVIDVSDRPLKPNVVRRGKQVPFVELDQGIVESIIGPGVIVQPGQAPRVVSQSIPPGTKVARGAGVDLVLAPRRRIPGGIFRGGHAGFKDRNVEEIVGTLLANDVVFSAVLDFEDPADLPPPSRQAIEAELEGADIAVDESDSSRDFAAAFRVLKGAAAYK
jgi:hypothetical protein